MNYIDQIQVGTTTYDIIDTNGRLLTENKLDKITSYSSGNIITINNAAETLLKNLKIYLNLTQDLHGYDAPWPAGGGKNLLNIGRSGTTTVNDVTFTINKDNNGNVISVKVNGTSSAEIWFNLYDTSDSSVMPLASGSYICSSGTTDANVKIRVANSGNSYIGQATTTPLTFTADGNGNVVQINITSGKTINNVIIYPMIRLSSVTDATFAPYSNVCPISGHSSAVVTRTGRNVFDWSAFYSVSIKQRCTATQTSDGKVTVTATDIGSVWVGIDNPVGSTISNTTYTIPAKVGDKFIASGWNVPTIYYHEIDKDGKIIARTQTFTGFTVTNPNCVRLAFRLVFGSSNAVGDTFTAYPLIEPGSVVHDYEPYQGQQVTIGLDGTHYGGTLNVLTGELTVTKVIETLTSVDYYVNGKRFQKATSNIAKYNLANTYCIADRILCSYYGTVEGANNATQITGFVWTNNAGTSSLFFVTMPDYTNITTKSQMDTWLASNPITFVYELATPLTVQLSPATLSLLLGENNIWSNTGDVEVTYYTNSIQDFDDRYYTENEINTLLNDKVSTSTLGSLATKNTVSWSTDITDIPLTFPPSSHNHNDKYYTENEIDTLFNNKANIINKITSGSLVHVTDAGVYPVNNLTIGIEPVQDLHGYDDPWSAGGGKNKLPNNATDETKSDNGITITASNGVYKISGTATGTVSISFDISTSVDLSPSTNKICFLNASVYNGVSVRFRRDTTLLHYWNMTEVNRVVSGWTDTGNEVINNILFYISEGTAISGTFTVSPMLMALTETNPTTYAPYSNICPISGHTQAVVTRCGTNLWDEQWEQGGINNTDGQNNNNTQIRSKNYIRVEPGMQLYCHGTTGGATNFITRWYRKDKTFLGTNPYMNQNSIVTVPANAYYLRFCFQAEYGMTYNNDFSLNYPSTDHAYHVHNFQTVTINLDGTRYGGSINVLTGEMTVDRKMVDLGDYTFVYVSDVSQPYFNRNFDDADPSYTTTKSDGLMCSMYPFKQITSGNTNEGFCFSTIYCRIRDTRYTDATTFKSAVTGVKLVYKLATPLTVQLSANTLSLLLGENNIWTNTGDIKLLNYHLPEYENFLNNLPIATTTTAGLLSPSDKIKLDNLSFGYDEITFTSNTTGTNYNWDNNNIIFDRTDFNYIPIYILSETTGNTLVATFNISSSTITYAADEKFSGTLFVMRKNN